MGVLHGSSCPQAEIMVGFGEMEQYDVSFPLLMVGYGRTVVKYLWPVSWAAAGPGAGVGASSAAAGVNGPWLVGTATATLPCHALPCPAPPCPALRAQLTVVTEGFTHS